MESKIIYIDPNNSNSNALGSVVTPEQLTISVQLETIKKDRSAIAVSKEKTEVKTGSKAIPIRFINGSPVGGVKNSLTTHYTEINTAFNKENKDLETLGIKDIQIEFNSSYAPLVVINFIDARGKLFEMGKDSPYSTFFELPYPVFLLTIKGFYGKAVQYRLHLTNFNGKFDYSTGSFEIQCNFIGYTYAFLSDVMMGHLKGIAYTIRGADKVKDKRLNDTDDHLFLTFSELNKLVGKISSRVGEIKENNPQLKAIKKSEITIDKLKEFKINLTSNLSTFNGTNGVKSSPIEGFYPILTQNSELSSRILSYNNLLKEEINNLNTNFLDEGYKLTLNKYLVSNGTSFLNKIRKEQFVGNHEAYINDFKGKDGYVAKIEGSKAKYVKFKDNIYTIGSVNDTTEFIVIDMIEAYDEINELIIKIESSVRDTKPAVSQSILNGGDIFNYEGKYFAPTIGNVVNLICDHIDIYLDCIREVAIEAEGNPDLRKIHLSKLGGKLDFVDDKQENLGNLKAFPAYSEIIDGVSVDRWIGNLAPDLPEVKFVEDLIEGMLKAKKDDDETTQGLNSGVGGPQWFPINPFDSIVNKVGNPYETLSDNGSTNEWLRLVILRAITYLGYTNSSLSIEDLKTMANLEANNAFEKVINLDIRAAIANFGNTSGFSSFKLIDQASKNYFQNTTYGLEYEFTSPTLANKKSESQIIRKYNASPNSTYGDSKFKYYYVYAPNINLFGPAYTTQTRYLEEGFNFLPLTLNNDTDSFNTDFLLVDETGEPLGHADRVRLRDEEGLTFFSNKLGNETTSWDDGATTIKIFDSVSSIDGKINYPSYGADVDASTKVIDMDETILNTGFGYNYFRVKCKNYEEMSSALLFYSNETMNGCNAISSKKLTTDKKYELYNMTNSTLPKVGKDEGLHSVKFNLLRQMRKVDNLRDTLIKGVSLTTHSIPFIGFNTNNYTKRKKLLNDNDPSFNALFGSDFYYSQSSKKAKAFLFLHTIPFEGLNNKVKIGDPNSGLFSGDYISKLLDQKGGFIEVPYSWIVFVGGILARLNDEFEVKFEDLNMSYIHSNSIGSYPEKNEFLISTSTLITDNNFMSFKDTDTYVKIDKRIQGLPESAKTIFIKEFNNWVDEGFTNLREEYEIFNAGVTRTQRLEYWKNFNNLCNNPQTLYSNPILNPKIHQTYDVFYKEGNHWGDDKTIGQINTLVKNSDTGSPFNFFLMGKDGSEASNQYISFVTQTRVLGNSTWRTWLEEPLDTDTYINVRDKALEVYLTTFFDSFIKLNKSAETVALSADDTTKEQLFNTINNDDIKLNLYIKIKSLYDKWICGEDEKYVGIESGQLYNSFKFIDRAYENIEDEFKVNLIPMVTNLSSNYNQSFYNYLARILGDNNFDFIPLPSYINYNNIADVSEVFKAFTYNTAPTSFGPQFICMYMGERSNVLDYGGNFKNDGFDFGVDEAADFKTNKTDKNNGVPVFLVDYGKDNQSVFKDIQLNQSEFTATDESLVITDALSNTMTGQGMGQNLFDVYNNRSYTANVEMLGNAMIQPLMHFQLSGIPIFHGAYTVIKVKHSITANTMTTNFTGVRIRKVKTKMIDDSTIFMNMFNGLEGVGTDNANMNNLIGGNSKTYANAIPYSSFVNYKLCDGKKPGLVKQGGEIDEYCIKEVGEFIEFIANKWRNENFSKYCAHNLHYNDLSKFGGGYNGHKSLNHQIGTAIDFRQITNSKDTKVVNVGDPHYDSEKTMELLNMFISEGKKAKAWGEEGAIEVIYFNDPVIIAQSNGKVKASKGHSNHVHISFNVPTRVRLAVKENEASALSGNGVTSSLTPIPSSLIPSKEEKLSFLGQINDAKISKVQKAFLDTISFAEGTIGLSNNGYDVSVGNRAIVGWNDNTNIVHGNKDWYLPSVNSTASGRYQFTYATWVDRNKMVNAPMTSSNQNKAAISLLEVRKPKGFVIDSIVERSKFVTLINELKKNTWVGFTVLGVDKYFDVFNKALGKYT